MLVRTHMTPKPITLRPDTDYKTALALMQTHAIHHLPVIGSDERLVGIVAERDLLLAAFRYTGSAVDVAQVMHGSVITVRADTPVTHAATLMVQHAIGGLPVVDGGDRVVGVITETDIFRAFVKMLDGARSAVPARNRAAKPAAKRKAPAGEAESGRPAVKAQGRATPKAGAKARTKASAASPAAGRKAAATPTGPSAPRGRTRKS